MALASFLSASPCSSSTGEDETAVADEKCRNSYDEGHLDDPETLVLSFDGHVETLHGRESADRTTVVVLRN